MTEIIKTCPAHGALTINDVNLHQKATVKKNMELGKISTSYTCKKCNYERQKKCPTYNREYQLAWERQQASDLTDYYIRKRIRGNMKIRSEDITQELIDTQRALIKINRLIKEREG